MRTLVTGGLGFIGGAIVNMLAERGHETVVINDGRDSVADGKVSGEIWRMGLDDLRVPRLAARFRPEVVIHLAAVSSVGHAEADPIGCARNNICAFASFLDGMASTQERLRIVNASSCAVYGTAQRSPVDEGHPVEPTSWYGWTKAAVEALLRSMARNGSVQAVSLRLANVVGSAYDIVEHRQRTDRLVPRAIDAALRGLPFVINGTDWPTSDGSCVRDYVHVIDVAEAFVAAAVALVRDEDFGNGQAVNIGSRTGRTVLEVVQAVREVSRRGIDVVLGPRCPGDPASFIASVAKAERLLGWKPQRSLEDAIRDAWRAEVRA